MTAQNTFRRSRPLRALAGWAAAAAIGVSLHAAAQVAAESPLARAKSLIERKQADEAYRLLVPLEGTRAGEAEFDYWLGVAAFETNRLERAALAFERALVGNPDFDAARLELGRTLLRMGSLDLAEQEFKRLSARAPAGPIKTALENYLAEIAKARAKERFAFTPYVEAGGGHDNNLSSTANDFSTAVQTSFGLAGILPTGNSIKRGDGYGSVAAGFELANRYAEDRTAFAAVNARGRIYRKERDFNSALADILAGHEWRIGERSVSLSAFAQHYAQKGAFDPAASTTRITNDRTVAGVGADWRTPFGNESTLGIGAQVAAVRYRTNDRQDTDQATLSATWQTAPSSWEGGYAAASTFYTKDRAKHMLSAAIDTDVTRHTFGLRVAFQTDPKAAFSWSAALGWARRNDDRPFARATLVDVGRDDLIDLGLRGSWRLTASWALQPYINALRNRSNIALYSFQKTDVGFVLRGDFK